MKFTMSKEAQMIRSLYAVPATLCLAAAVVTAQAPAGEKPTTNPPATQQPAGQPPAGQQPSTQKPTTPPSSAQQPSSTMSGNKVTYSGCIKPGTTAGTWVLENAEAAQKTGAPGSAVGTSGAGKMSLNLDPAASVNLKAHANHKVELVGTLSAAKGGATSSTPGGAAGAASTPGAAGTQTSGQNFSVESLKMVS